MVERQRSREPRQTRSMVVVFGGDCIVDITGCAYYASGDQQQIGVGMNGFM